MKAAISQTQMGTLSPNAINPRRLHALALKIAIYARSREIKIFN
jgi:hypothetical protein